MLQVVNPIFPSYHLYGQLEALRITHQEESDVLKKKQGIERKVLIKQIQDKCQHQLDIVCYRTNASIDGRSCIRCRKYFKGE